MAPEETTALFSIGNGLPPEPRTVLNVLWLQRTDTALFGSCKERLGFTEGTEYLNCQLLSVGC